MNNVFRSGRGLALEPIQAPASVSRKLAARRQRDIDELLDARRTQHQPAAAGDSAAGPGPSSPGPEPSYRRGSEVIHGASYQAIPGPPHGRPSRQPLGLADWVLCLS